MQRYYILLKATGAGGWPGFRFPMFRWMTCWPKSRAGRRANHGCGKK